ncbi:MAG: tRNA (adenosine(37)-N6)-dimethylallyltransferase MiaA [Lachnospiraceae bacterium]|nr:tRNA (adenosine(37)-N6)-dimethylallyltransferase MiaA [Lachnospiraceae bacterium]
MYPPLIILSGPTSVGKTRLSLRLAEAVNGEIISADSMQVYKRMNIGTAKITKEEMGSIPHHLIDCLEPEEPFNVSLFKDLAGQAVKGILSRNHIPIVVGGTGFYIQALLKGVTFSEEEEDGYREELEQKAQSEEGAEALFEELKRIDPDSAVAIPKQNLKRVIRALCFYHYHGYPISEHNRTEKEKEPEYNFAYFVLTTDRAALYQNINKRVDQMMDSGLLEEVRGLRESGLTATDVSMQGLGYKQLIAYLDGECTLAEAAERIKTETRHFAKRQLTWFRREKDCIFFDKSKQTEDEILADMIRILKEKRIIPLE